MSEAMKILTSVLLAACSMMLPATGSNGRGSPGPLQAPEHQADQQPSRKPIPSKAERARARVELKKTYAREFADEHAENKVALAAKLLQPGRENRDDPAAWFALLETARDLAAQSGRAHLAFEAIRELEQWFQVDGRAMRLRVLASIDPASSEEAARSRGEAALSMIRKAVIEDNCVLAERLLKLATEAVAQLPSNKKAQSILAAYRSEVAQARKGYGEMVLARAELKSHPQDARANAQVGKFLALVHGRWDEALPYLAKGDDEALKQLATRDLARPSGAEGQVELADAWWHLAESLKYDAMANCRCRAAHWYEEARYRAEPFEKPKIEARIKKANEQVISVPARVVPGSYFGRGTADRILLLRRGGGTMQSEQAVERGLRWLAEHQADSGMWSLNRFAEVARCTCKDPGQAFDVGGTALALLPMLAAGNTHKQGPYAPAVKKGIRWLLYRQQRDGSFSYNVYENALATIALCEDYGMSHDARFKAPAQAALNCIILTQSASGGWSNAPDVKGDLSTSGLQFAALKAGDFAGLVVPDAVMKKFAAFLDKAEDPNGVGYDYNTAEADPSTSAVGLLCRQYLGWGPANQSLRKGAMQIYRRRDFTIANKPSIYFLYYATQVMHHFGGKEWQEWNKIVRDFLIETQEKGSPEVPQDHHIGSWSPVGDELAAHGGRVFYTAMAVLTLETYYASVPLYECSQIVRFE
jgi:hypothetical protein